MSEPYAVVALADLPEGAHTIVEVDGREIGVFNVAGSFYALPNVCSHQQGPVCRGPVSGTVVADRESGWRPVWAYEGEILSCPWHMLEFNITTGRCVSDPARRLPRYRVEVEADHLRVYARARNAPAGT